MYLIFDSTITISELSRKFNANHKVHPHGYYGTSDGGVVSVFRGMAALLLND